MTRLGLSAAQIEPLCEHSIVAAKIRRTPNTTRSRRIARFSCSSSRKGINRRTVGRSSDKAACGKAECFDAPAWPIIALKSTLPAILWLQFRPPAIGAGDLLLDVDPLHDEIVPEGEFDLRVDLDPHGVVSRLGIELLEGVKIKR